MKSPPGLSVVNTSADGDGSDSGADVAAAARAGDAAGACAAAFDTGPAAATAAPVAAACFRKRRRPIDVLRMRESLIGNWGACISRRHEVHTKGTNQFFEKRV